MIACPYVTCRMRNLCKGSHCVRQALEKDGYRLTEDGTLERTLAGPAAKRETKDA